MLLHAVFVTGDLVAAQQLGRRLLLNIRELVLERVSPGADKDCRDVVEGGMDLIRDRVVSCRALVQLDNLQNQVVDDLFLNQQLLAIVRARLRSLRAQPPIDRRGPPVNPELLDRVVAAAPRRTRSTSSPRPQRSADH